MVDLVARHQLWMRERGLTRQYVGERGRLLGVMAGQLGKPVADANFNDLEKWRHTLNHLSPDSICIKVAHVREYCRWLIDFGHRRHNYSTRLVVPKRIRRMPRPIEESNIKLAVGHAQPDMRMILALGCLAGFRACETAGLRWEYVQLPSNWRSLDTAVPGRILVVAETTKGRRERWVPICRTLAAELDRYGVRPSGWVIPRRDGGAGPNRPGTISLRVGRFFRDLGLGDTNHGCRHRFATVALELCGNPRVVQELLGHAQLATTQVYTLVSSVSAESAVADLSWVN